jgi:TonB family protein
MPNNRAWPYSVAALALATALPVMAFAQTRTISGIVRDSAGARIANAQIIADGRVPVVSALDGSFRLTGLPPVSARIQIRRLGFSPLRIDVPYDDTPTTQIEIILAAVALELTPVVVNARVDPAMARLAGFFQRKERGQGYFVTRDQIERTGNSPLSNVLRTFVPSARVQSRGQQRSTIRLRGANCPPLVWLDGVAYLAAEFDIDYVSSWSVSGVEVYSGPASVPSEFRSVRGLDRCGVIVIWSRNDVVDGIASRRSSRRPANAEPARIFFANEVDRPARLDSTKTFEPFYPDSLYAFRIPGDVTVEVVIDSTGTPVMDTFAALTSTHPAFTESVRRAISRATFFPALVRGRPVRQLLVLPFQFKAGEG